MAKLASFWTGPALGPIELTSIRSFLRQGDQITVYSPEMLDLPEGAIWRDASDIMPSSKIIVNRRSGSPALHSDLFRYAMLRKTDEIWVDLDIIALRPFVFSSPYVFGYEGSSEVNGAVLRLPPDSQTLRLLSQYNAQSSGMPPAMFGIRKFKYYLRSKLTHLSIDKWPWGAIGPRALTYFLNQTGEIRHALPQSAFYSVPLGEVGRFVEPGALTRADLPADAFGVHLWGKELRGEIKAKYNGNIPEGSFLGQVMRELDP